jgi:hypothetical protein
MSNPSHKWPTDRRPGQRACQKRVAMANRNGAARGSGTFRYLKGERSDGTLTFLDQKAAD